MKEDDIIAFNGGLFKVIEILSPTDLIIERLTEPKIQVNVELSDNLMRIYGWSNFYSYKPLSRKEPASERNIRQ